MSSSDSHINSLVNQIKSLSTLTDHDTILSVLAAHQYDIDSTVSYLQSNGLAKDNNTTRTSNNNNNTTRSRSTQSNNRTTTRSNSSTDTGTAASWYDTIPGIYYVYTTFQWIKTIASYLLPEGWIETTEQSQLTESEWIQSLEERYEHALPNIYNGTYPAAVRHAKNNNKLLLVYLHAETHSDTQSFIDHTLCNESVRNFINENVILWCGNIIHRDAYRLCHTLHATQFPFIALLSTQLTGNQVALLYKHMGTIDADTLIAQLLHGIESNTMSMSRQQQQQRDSQTSLQSNRTVIAEQDKEYLDALAADQENRKRRQLEAEQLKLQEQAKHEIMQKQQAEQQQAEQAKQARIKYKQALLQQLPIEPSPSSTVVHVAIKLPSNKTYKRRFEPSNTLQTVFDYINTLDDSVVDEPHIVLSNFPRRVYTDTTVQLQELKLGKQIMLYVEADEADDESQCRI